MEDAKTDLPDAFGKEVEKPSADSMGDNPVEILRSAGVMDPESVIEKLKSAGYAIEKSGAADVSEDAAEASGPTFGASLDEQLREGAKLASEKRGGK